MKTSAVLFLFCFVSIVSAQQKNNDSVQTSASAAVFRQLAEQWKLAYNSNDAKNFIPLYTENAQYISGHVPGYEANGRDKVISNFQRGMNQGGHIDSVDVQSVNISFGIAAVVTRYYATNSGVSVSGRNLLVSKFIDGRWQIVTHMTVIKD